MESITLPEVMLKLLGREIVAWLGFIRSLPLRKVRLLFKLSDADRE
jgi:hypothetical protein